MGTCYLLKLFLSDKKFESLNWFTSVIDFYDNKKSGKKSDKKTKVEVLAERGGESYKEQFELQFLLFIMVTYLEIITNVNNFCNKPHSILPNPLRTMPADKLINSSSFLYLLFLR